MLPDDPGGDPAGLELAALEHLVRAVPLPQAVLPGWESLTAHEYALALRRLTELLDSVAVALAAARASG